MRNTEFYGLTAQVLPTLLIAVVLELRFIVPRAVQAGRIEEGAGTSRSAWSVWEVIGTGSTIAYLAVAVTFVIAEFTAVLVVFNGADGWLPILAGPANLTALALLMLTAVTAPFIAMWTVVVTTVSIDYHVDD